MKKILLLLLFAGYIFPTVAQTDPDTLSRKLVGSMGGFFDAGELSIQYSVGEPMVRTKVSAGGSVVLTQGFQQENLYPVSIDDEITAMMDIQYWPNPTPDIIHLRVSSDIMVELNAGIYDLLGRPVGLPTHDMRIQAPQEVQFDVEPLTEGSYYIMFRSTKGKIVHAIKIQKVD